MILLLRISVANNPCISLISIFSVIMRFSFLSMAFSVNKPVSSLGKQGSESSSNCRARTNGTWNTNNLPDIYQSFVIANWYCDWTYCSFENLITFHFRVKMRCLRWHQEINQKSIFFDILQTTSPLFLIRHRLSVISKVMSVIIFYGTRMIHGQIPVLHVDPRCPHSQHKTAAFIPARGLEERGNNLTFFCNKKIERN